MADDSILRRTQNILFMIYVKKDHGEGIEQIMNHGLCGQTYCIY